MTSTKMYGSSPKALPVLSTVDYVELFVGNVRQSAHYYHTVWNFDPIAFCGLETGVSDYTSIAMRQGNIVLVLTGALKNSSEAAEHLRIHGEGVGRIAFAVDDALAAYEAAVSRGAKSVRKPWIIGEEGNKVWLAEVMAVDGFSHAFIDRRNYSGPFLPGFRLMLPKQNSEPLANDLDHIAVAVERGTLESWVTYYERVFGFERAHREDIATELSGMNSVVVQHPSGLLKFPLVEPALTNKKSQVQEFVDFNCGPGVQHLALGVSNICSTVRKLKNNGVEFLAVPDSYYDDLERRIGTIEGLATLKDLGILVDHDEWGHLFQIFARPHEDRPTFFFELVERRGARGFGAGNIRALFESVEREQALRRTL